MPKSAFVSLAILLLMPTAAWAVLDVDAGPDVTLECTSDDGAEYTLNGSVPDLEGLEFVWSTDTDVELVDDDTLTPTGDFPVGDTIVTLSASTDLDSGSNDATVTVEDATAPVVKAKAEPYFLWPPNHSMHEVNVRLKIRDACTDEDDYQVELVSATSNEPDNGSGDGNTTNDIQDDDIGTDDREVLLRAERKGNGDGRIYTLVYRVTDSAGNETEAEAKVYVPHDANDLKALIASMSGDRDEFEPICPRPRDAADEFLKVLPMPSDFGSARACTRACRAWARGCGGIVRGARHCVRAEAKSLLALEKLMCREISDRYEARECENYMRTEHRNEENSQRGEERLAKKLCGEEADECAERCDDYFNVEPYED